MKNCVVIFNPNSGNSLKSEDIFICRKYLKEYGYIPRFMPTQYAGHAKEIVSHIDKIDVVFSIGGDGTFNEVVTGNLLRKDRLVLCHIPVGTTNDVGKMFGYGKIFENNLKLALEGEVKKIDICLINDRPFVYVAGLGKFVTVAYDTPRYLKEKMGYLAYLIEGVKDFFKPIRLYNISYKINGIEKTGYYSLVLISNANRIAGINNFYKDVKLNDNQFEVLLCNFRNRIDIAKTVRLLMTNDINKVSGVEFYKTNKVEMRFEDYPKKGWCIDGEKLDRSTLDYEISMINNFEILMPTTYNDELFLNEKKES